MEISDKTVRPLPNPFPLISSKRIDQTPWFEWEFGCPTKEDYCVTTETLDRLGAGAIN